MATYMCFYTLTVYGCFQATKQVVTKKPVLFSPWSFIEVYAAFWSTLGNLGKFLSYSSNVVRWGI